MTKPTIQKRVEKILGETLSKTARQARDIEDEEIPVPRKLIPKEPLGFSPKNQYIEQRDSTGMLHKKQKSPPGASIEVYDLKLNHLQSAGGKDMLNNFIMKKSKNNSFVNHKFSSESGLQLKLKESETPKRRDNITKASINSQKPQIETIVLKKEQPAKEKPPATAPSKRHSVKLTKGSSKQNLRNSETLNLNQTVEKKQTTKPNYEARRKTELPAQHLQKDTSGFKKPESRMNSSSNPTNLTTSASKQHQQVRPPKLIIKDRSLSPLFEYCSEQQPDHSLPMRASLLSQEDITSKKYKSEAVNVQESAGVNKNRLEVLVSSGTFKDQQESKKPQKSPPAAQIIPQTNNQKILLAKKSRKTESISRPAPINQHIDKKTRHSVTIKLPSASPGNQDSPQVSNKKILQTRLSHRESMLKERLAQTNRKTGGSFINSKEQFITPRISLLKAQKQTDDAVDRSPVWYSSSKKSSEEKPQKDETAAPQNRKSEAALKPNHAGTSRDKKFSVYASDHFGKASSNDDVADKPVTSYSEKRNSHLFDRIAKKFEEKAARPQLGASFKSRDPVLIYKKSDKQLEQKPLDGLQDLKSPSEAKDQNLKLGVEMVYVNPKYSLNRNSFIQRYEDHYHLDKTERQQSDQAQQKSLNEASTSASGQFVLPNKGLKDLIIDNRIIGKGSYAVVKTAYHIPSKIEVAVKIYDKFKMTDHRKKGNLKCEVSNLKEMDHTGVVKLFQKIEDATKLYLIMEFAGNYHLKDYLKLRKEGWIRPRETKGLFFKIVKGVEHIHNKNIVHRDLKLQNIVVKNLDTPKIVDFGFSRKGLYLNFDDHCGTPNYMAPELLSPKKSRKAIYADIWALGIILFYLLTEEYPFRGKLQ